jgi:hypothetical protein
MELSVIHNLAVQFVYAKGVKEAARLRKQCDLKDWTSVLEEAKRIYRREQDSRYARRG